MPLNQKTTSIPCAVILTAIPIEYMAVRGHLRDIEEVCNSRGNVYEKGLLNGFYHKWNIGIAEIGPGNFTCGMEVERAIQFFEPQIIIFVGIAGGIKDLELGDVVAVEKAYGYEFGKIAKNGFITRPEIGKSSYSILNRAKAEARKDDWKKRIIDNKVGNNPKVIVKPIASGEKLITSRRNKLYQLILSHYNDSVAVEMEGSGFYAACQANEGLQFLIVRGISDLLSNKSQSDKKGYQIIAAKNASAFAFEVLSKYKII